MQLRPYQEEALEAITKGLERGVNKQMLVASVGAGKTVMASYVPKIHPGKTLFLAHRYELLEQTYNTMKIINPDASIAIEQADKHASVDDDIVIASVQTLGRNESDRIMKFPRNHFTNVIIDEVHHLSHENSTYINIIEYFQSKLRLGITATPQRSDKKSLVGLLDEIVFFKPMEALIKEGYLTPIVGYRIQTDTDISSVKTRAGDYAIGELSEAVNIKERNEQIVAGYQEIAEGKKAIAFCVDVAHAYELAATFNRMGVSARAVCGETPAGERAQLFSDFKQGKFDVLCNVGITTEGWDEPSLEVVMFARPTKSKVFYLQALGRGVRTFEGKEACIVIDYADATKGKTPVSLPTLMGLPEDFDAEGEDVLEVVDEYKALEEEAPQEAMKCKTKEDIKQAWERIDLFTQPPINEELLEYTEFVWMESGPERYNLNLPNGERLRIEGDALGRYQVSFKHETGLYKLGVVDTIEEAFGRTDKWIIQNRGDKLNLIKADAPWRNDPVTESQKKWLKKFDVPITASMSKGEASAILDKMFEKNPKPQKARPKWLEEKIARERAQKRMK